METEVRLNQYLQLVRQYAKVLDLGSPKLLERFEIGFDRSRPFADALESGSRVLDIGSGAGLPGIPVAILRHDIQLTLCEIRVKRAAFLERAVSLLGLDHVTVYNGDVQKLTGRFDAVTALWVGSLEKLYLLCRHALESEWKLIVRKGDEFESELEALRTVAQVRRVHVKHLDDGAILGVIEGVL